MLKLVNVALLACLGLAACSPGDALGTADPFTRVPVADTGPVQPLQPAASGKPNVVVIYTDDQPVGTLDAMSNVQRELVKQGVHFTDAHIPTSTCCPSRASLLTGMTAQGTGVWTNWAPNGGFDVFYNRGLESDTLATRLDAAGYRTALVGKYLNGYGEGPERVAITGSDTYIPPGWDVWHAFAYSDGAVNTRSQGYVDYSLMHRTETEPVSFTQYGSTDRDYSTNVLSRIAVDTIASTPADTPLFMLVTPYGPHSGYNTTKKYRKAPVPDPQYLPPGFADATGKPRWVQNMPTVRPSKSRSIRTKQIRSLYPVDDAVKNIVAALRDSNRLRDTLLVFMSDNGYTWGQFNIIGMKNFPYTTHVPLVLRWDAKNLSKGSTDARMVANVDVTHTIAQAAGVGSFAPDGVNLVDRSDARKELVVSAWRNRGGSSKTRMPAYCGLRTERWLYVRYSKGVEELYRLTDDPHLLRNLAQDRKFSRVKSNLRADTRTSCSPVPPGFSWSK